MVTAQDHALALALIGMLLVSGCTGAVGDGDSSDGAAVGVVGVEPSPATGSPTPPDAVVAVPWADAVGDLCEEGMKLYPNVRLGHRADVDTVSYGLTKHASALAALDLPADEATRALALDLTRRTAVVAAHWAELAGAPRTTVAERRAAAEEAAAVFGGLVAAGAEQCEALAPSGS